MKRDSHGGALILKVVIIIIIIIITTTTTIIMCTCYCCFLVEFISVHFIHFVCTCTFKFYIHLLPPSLSPSQYYGSRWLVSYKMRDTNWTFPLSHSSLIMFIDSLDSPIISSFSSWSSCQIMRSAPDTISFITNRRRYQTGNRRYLFIIIIIIIYYYLLLLLLLLLLFIIIYYYYYCFIILLLLLLFYYHY